MEPLSFATEKAEVYKNPRTFCLIRGLMFLCSSEVVQISLIIKKNCKSCILNIEDMQTHNSFGIYIGEK